MMWQWGVCEVYDFDCNLWVKLRSARLRNVEVAEEYAGWCGAETAIVFRVNSGEVRMRCQAGEGCKMDALVRFAEGLQHAIDLIRDGRRWP